MGTLGGKGLTGNIIEICKITLVDFFMLIDYVALICNIMVINKLYY